VGYAARSGLEFMTIYLGPTLVFVGWWVLLTQTGADRAGTSRHLYRGYDFGALWQVKPAGRDRDIALRLGRNALYRAATAIHRAILSPCLQPIPRGPSFATDRNLIAFWVAAGLALFTIAFGTRNLDANEQHPGVVTAIAVEAVVKLLALIAVGVFAVWFVASGPADILARIDEQALPEWHIQPGRWTGLSCSRQLRLYACRACFR
jgi:hypothetical protein